MRTHLRLIVLLGAILGFALSFGRPAALSQAPGRAGGALALAEGGQKLLAVNPDSNSLSIFDTATRQKLVEIPVGVDPRSVVVAYDERAVVANRGSDSLSIIDLTTLAVEATLPVGAGPVSLALSPSGGLLAVAELGDDQVRFLDVRNFAPLQSVPVADRPSGVAFTPDGNRLVVSHLLSGKATVLAVQPFRQYLPWIERQALAEGMLLAGLEFLSQPLFSLDTVITTWPNVAPAPGVVVNSAGTRAYLPQTMANGLGLNVQFDNSVFPKVSVLNLEDDTHQTSEHISLPETDQPVGLPWAAGLAKADTELWVVNAASSDLSVIDISNPTQPLGAAHILVGANPRGIVFSPDETVAYVNNTLAGTISVLDTYAYTVTEVITSTKIPLPPLLLNGKRLFNSSARPELSQARWIACNTCHIEGEQDGRIWRLQFLGEAPIRATTVITRNTTSLLGMIQTYPLRWSAEWNESADSEFAIRFEQFGAGLIAGEMHPTLGEPNQGRAYDLDSLAAFIDSLPAPTRVRALTAAELNGKALFFAAETGCATCHPPPYYTDFQPHDVGTANAPWEWFGPFIDTPTLRFLHDSAPYLHHGGAPALLDVLTTANPDDQHGTTSQLTSQELADLIAFLLALPYEE